MDQKEFDQLHQSLEKKLEEMICNYNDHQDLDNWHEDKAALEADQLYLKIDGMNLALESLALRHNLKYKELAKPPYISIE